MANWNQKTANYIKDQIKTWSEEFFQSTTLDATKGTEIIATFADKMYETHERTPKSWVGYGAKEVVAANFSNKEEAITYLEAFFQFLNEAGYIKNASALTKAIHEAKDVVAKPVIKTETVPVSVEKTTVVKKEVAKETLNTTTSKNPYNQMVKERNLKNKRLGKKKNRKKHHK